MTPRHVNLAWAALALVSVGVLASCGQAPPDLTPPPCIEWAVVAKVPHEAADSCSCLCSNNVGTPFHHVRPAWVEDVRRCVKWRRS